MSQTRRAALVWSLLAVILGGFSAAVLLDARTAERGGPVAFAPGGIAFAAVGALIVLRRPRHRVGWLFLATALGGVLGQLANEYATYRGGALPGARWAAWVFTLSIEITFPALLFTLLLFPDGRFLSQRWRTVGWLALTIAAFGILATALSDVNFTNNFPQMQTPVQVIPGDRLEPVYLGYQFAVMALLAAGGWGVVLRFRRAQREERQQLKWFAYAAAVLALAFLVLALAPLGIEPVVAVILFVPLLPISAGIAVLKHRLYDIDVVINKTLVYGALAVFITMVYVGVVVGLGNLLGTGGELNLPLQVAATALVAVAFQPVRARVQRLANRLVYGERATPYEVMTDFAARMSGVIEVEEVLPRIAEAAARGVGGVRGRAAVFLSDGSRREERWPLDAPDLPDDVFLPAEHAGERVGEIAVAKGPGDPLRAGEEALLRDLASQAGVALHNVRLAADLRERLEEISRRAEELRRSRARLLTAADGERRRLERTIERGPQRRLDAITGALREALASLDAGPGVVAPLVAGLRDDARAALEEVRDLARGIYPPLLADAGLAAALEAEARKLSVVTVITDGIARYPEDVESGVYFCVLEALRGASVPVTVRLFEADEVLGFEVGAEGSLRLDEEVVRGIRDRVEALGGEVASGAREIRARIPARATEPVG